MPTGGSLGSGSGSFDLHSQAGVMALLAAVRLSALTSHEKAEVRDLVFQYANGGGDVTVRRALEQKIVAHGLVPAAPGALKKAQGTSETAAPLAPAVTSLQPPAVKVRPLGGGRRVPQFSPVSIVGDVAAIPVPAPAPIVAPEPAPVRSPAPAPVIPTPAPAPLPEPIASPPGAVPHNTPSPVAIPVAQVAPAPAPEPSPSNAATVETFPAGAAALERIRVIKATVNQKVGNPVNLVDIDNTVGREYMMALLEAMKKVSGGVPGDLSAAMERLEQAYQMVELAILNHEATTGAGEVPAVPVSSTMVAAAAVELPEATPPVPVLEVVESVPPPSPSISPQPPAPPVTPRVEPVAPLAPSSLENVGYRAPSLADDATVLRTIQDLPEASSIETSSVTGDPLFTKEIDSGLDQLLAEWAIFKKSGLFGTGPKGREHPLFKTLATVTIPLILAGRYDGATNEIRQSITDYMNGWRYEQGIVYQEEETFEHYLRRVIRHIVDWQKRRTGA